MSLWFRNLPVLKNIIGPVGNKYQHDQHPSYSCRQDFEYITPIGTGTYARVYLVQHKSTGKHFALKVMKKQHVILLQQSAAILREKAILSSLSHPNVVRLHATFSDVDCIYLLMDFESGGELFSHLSDCGSFSEPATKFYIGCVVLAIEYLHKSDVIFRDLKPENLLLGKNGYLKLTDFGFAKKLPSKTHTLCGTPDYMAPEVIRGDVYDKEVDWWSLGVLMFELLAGRTPFASQHETSIYQKIMFAQYTFPPHFSFAAREMLKAFLRVQPRTRLGSRGAKDVMTHPWFHGFDWEALRNGTMEAPYIPPSDGEDDTQNFDEFPEVYSELDNIELESFFDNELAVFNDF